MKDNYAEAQDYKSRCEKLREYINTHQLFKYIYDDEELFEIITDKEAKKKRFRKYIKWC